MSSRAIAAVVAFMVVAVVAAIVLVLRAPSRDGRAAAVGERAHEAGERSPVPDERTTAQRVAESTRSAPSAESTRLTLASAVASGVAALTPSDPVGLEVRVVRRYDQRPAGDAIVAAVDIEVLIRQRVSIQTIAGDLRRFVGGMVLVRADEKGVARMPRRFFQMMLIAELGELRGTTGAVGSQTEPDRIELSPPTTVRAQVLDAEGRPKTGVTVELNSSTTESATTQAPDGIATFSDLELDGILFSQRSGGRDATLLVDAPLIDWPRANVDLTHPPSEPVLLRVGACGTLVVRVVDADGHPVPTAGVVVLEWLDAKRRDEPPFSFALERSGETTLPCVEPGCRFTLRTTLLERDPTSLEIVGPRWAGDVATVDVPLASAHVVLVGRAVDAAGQPLATSSVVGRVAFDASTKEIGRQDLFGRLDADGSFRVDWSDRGIDPAARPESIRWRASTGPPLESRVLPFPALPTAGEVALGDVVFETPPLLARGRVVDDQGRPIAQATVVTKWPDGSKTRLRPGIDAESRGDGTFELRGFEAADELLAFAVANEAFSEAVPLPRDGSELRLVIPRRGDVEGRLRAVPQEFRGSFSIELRGSELFGDRTLDANDLASDGSFRFEGMAPGTYDLEVSLARNFQLGESLLRVENVVVAPGETTRDPRLLDLDPWARVRYVEVHVDLADGAAVERVEAVTLSDGWASSWIVRQPGSVARVPTTRDRVDVAVRVDGYRQVVVPAVADRASVTLQPAYRVRLALGPLPTEYSKKTPTQLSLERSDHRFPMNWTRVDRVLREGQEWTVPIPFAGEYVGHVGFVDDPSDRKLDMVPVAPIVVDDSSEEQARTLIVAPKRDGR
ncbi:MAG TPA: hypothetical protein VFG37_11520 [Planctomycetota bacterium]|nr:hypothetical protein [Planctomycetota bacterium]